MSIFISYAVEDSELAKLIKGEIEEEFRGAVSVFLAGDFESNRPGDEWWENIRNSLKGAKLTLVLATPVSISKPWINFEAGSALGTGARLLPLCAYGLHISDLGPPLNYRQAIDLAETEGVDRLFRIVADTFSLRWPGQRDLSRIREEAIRVSKDSPDRLLHEVRETGVNKLLFRSDLSNRIHELRWDQLIDKCRRSVRVVGWSCMNVSSGETRDLFRKLLTEGNRRLEFLVLDPKAVEEATSLNFGPVCNIEHREVLFDLDKSIEPIRQLVQYIPAEHKHKVELRITNWIIAWSAVAIDLDEQDGLIQIELYTYKQNIDRRPEIVIIPTQDGYYPVFQESLRNIWDQATEVKL